MKYRVRGEQEEPVVEFWLTHSTAGANSWVNLNAGSENGKVQVLSIGERGVTMRNQIVPNIGLPLDHRGRVRVANQSVKERYADELHGALKHLLDAPMWAATVGNALTLLHKIEAEENGDG